MFILHRSVGSAKNLDKVKLCCGQLILTGSGNKHMLCDGTEDSYHMGGLVMELEICPHHNCGTHFPMHPLENIVHQDTMHHSCLYSCGACQSLYLTEGALIRYVIRGHGGPVGFEVDLNCKHSPKYALKAPHRF